MDIDGSDAFDRVFEKALDLSVEIERQRATIGDKVAEIGRLNLAIKAKNDAAAAADSKTKNALEELWTAAKLVANQPTNLAAVDSLKKVLEATAELADPLPF